MGIRLQRGTPGCVCRGAGHQSGSPFRAATPAVRVMLAPQRALVQLLVGAGSLQAPECPAELGGPRPGVSDARIWGAEGCLSNMIPDIAWGHFEDTGVHSTSMDGCACPGRSIAGRGLVGRTLCGEGGPQVSLCFPLQQSIAGQGRCVTRQKRSDGRGISSTVTFGARACPAPWEMLYFLKSVRKPTVPLCRCGEAHRPEVIHAGNVSVARPPPHLPLPLRNGPG